MKQKFPYHPLIYALFPVLVVLLNTANQRHLEGALRAGVLIALGGVALYGVLWLVFRSPERAALLASLCVLLYFAYDPFYELLRGRELLGHVIGKHRYLLPVWLGLFGVCVAWLVKKFQRTRLLNGILNAGSLVLLVPSIALILGTGSWLTALRDAGIVAPPGLEVAYINVGDAGGPQVGVIGDSILLRSTEGKNVLIDAGYPNGLAAAYLKAQGVTHLDMIVMTHPHEDHDGGLVEIINTIPVDLFVSNGEPLEESAVYHELMTAIQRKAIPSQVVRSGDELPFGYLTFQVLSPGELSKDSVNHNSVVLRLVVGKVSFLFTGDSDALEQQHLVQTGKNVHATIYKIAHHGAYGNTDPEFLSKVNPDVAIYMAGTSNSYGFPEAPTLQLFQKMGIEVFGTDQNGTIVVKTDGKTYQVIPDHEASE